MRGLEPLHSIRNCQLNWVFSTLKDQTPLSLGGPAQHLNPIGTRGDKIPTVKTINWDPEKNARLRAERGISFEDVVFHMMVGDILDTLEHPNQERYPGQQIHVVAVEDYVFLVPFVETDDEVFLKTIIPSRKATRNYRGNPK